MADWSTVQIVLLAVASYVAVMSLVRLMRLHLNKVTEDLREKLAEEYQNQQAEAAAARRNAKQSDDETAAA